jgi:hypothetical protein
VISADHDRFSGSVALPGARPPLEERLLAVDAGSLTAEHAQVSALGLDRQVLLGVAAVDLCQCKALDWVALSHHLT